MSMWWSQGLVIRTCSLLSNCAVPRLRPSSSPDVSEFQLKHGICQGSCLLDTCTFQLVSVLYISTAPLSTGPTTFIRQHLDCTPYCPFETGYIGLQSLPQPAPASALTLPASLSLSPSLSCVLVSVTFSRGSMQRRWVVSMSTTAIHRAERGYVALGAATWLGL